MLEEEFDWNTIFSKNEDEKRVELPDELPLWVAERIEEDGIDVPGNTILQLDAFEIRELWRECVRLLREKQ